MKKSILTISIYTLLGLNTYGQNASISQVSIDEGVKSDTIEVPNDLPKVEITDLLSIEPYIENTPTNKNNHIGLTVLNTNSSDSIDSGIYTWNGNEWAMQYSSRNQARSINYPTSPWNKVGTNESSILNTDNSYLNAKAVVGGTTIIDGAQLSVHGDTKIKGTGNIQKKATIGISATSDKKENTGVLLELKEYEDATAKMGGRTSTKGLLLPRVILEDVNNLRPLIASGGSNEEKLNHKGLVVYHIGGNGIKKGQRIWDGTKWLETITEILHEVIRPNSYNLLQPAVAVASYADRTEEPGNATILAIGELNSTDSKYYIPIHEDGSYTFAFRYYGNAGHRGKGGTGEHQLDYTRACFYLTLFVNGEKYDVQEFNISVHQYSNKLGATGFLAGKDIKIGDKVQIGFSYFIAGDTNPAFGNKINFEVGTGIVANRTSVVYWKL